MQYLDATWQPDDYQKLLLTRLGDDDPAEVQSRTPVALRGSESYELTFRITAGHDLIHVDQARKTLEALRD